MRKTVLILAAGSPAGRSLAEGLARAGFDVALHHRGPGGDAREVARRVRSAGRRALVVEGDPGDPASAATLVRRVQEDFGRLDVLLNGAGDPAEIFVAVQAAFPALSDAGGEVVNLVPPRGHPLAARELLALTRGLAGRLGPRVRVNAVAVPLQQDAGADGVRGNGAAGTGPDLLRTVLFLLASPWMNGEVLAAGETG